MHVSMCGMLAWTLVYWCICVHVSVYMGVATILGGGVLAPKELWRSPPLPSPSWHLHQIKVTEPGSLMVCTQ